MPSSTPASCVFVGGTGRSGTTAIGALIGQHPRFACPEYEVKVHNHLGRVARGTMSVEEFCEHAEQFFRQRFDVVMGRDEFDAVLADYRSAAAGDAWGAGAQFVRSVMGSYAARRRKPAWVDMTPYNMAAAADLVRLLPEARLVHAVRDGRDCAASIASVWGRMDADTALQWWGRRMLGIARQLARVPAAQLLTVQLEDLVVHRREDTYQALLAFLGVVDDPSTRDHFEGSMDARRAHAGRWARDLSAEEQSRVNAAYARLLETLEGAALPGVDALRRQFRLDSADC